VTRYAYDPDRCALLCTWPTGAGDQSRTLVTLKVAVSEDLALQVAGGLTHLSATLWRTYTHPASAANDDLSANTKGWRRDQDREAFAQVAGAVQAPNLPQNGMLVQSYTPTEEAAHRVGRLLHQAGSTSLTDAVVADLEAEMGAIDRAERGDLTGRASQAVVLTRAEASPVHVAAADALLNADPFGPAALICGVDPTAAAVAAAHWLAAAATVAAEASGDAVEMVVRSADDIEAIPTATATEVLSRITQGETPLDVVLGMIRIAMAIADGECPDVAYLSEILEEGDEITVDESVGLSQLGVRLTPLDPSRPAPDMLEDLLLGIHGAFLLWDECCDDGADGPEEEPTDEELALHHERRRAAFGDLVRNLAEDERGRIGL
jgi:hypothetical protein